MDMLSWLAEQKIAEAMARGEFDHLPGKGKPLKVEDLSGVPEDLRMAYKLMKNAGYVPEEIQLQQEMVRLTDLLAACEDEPERQALKKRLTEQELRLNMLMSERGLSTNPAFRQYEDAIRRKLE
ncbi:DnaJ family domain-containing protein [Paenibacillus phoenicis]|uniref:DnaJ family domain-containing protein n=1 Tax=Paenibacillus phoenicis TaxID=554117 RepID=A0ABU5PHG9_9BACL|nr:DnaJ family domain-containing protein [Paenibacillus phoenicis]MEA3569394.1 DnaJ family domain-containing protein [Paenibacillus phoenicis]